MERAEAIKKIRQMSLPKETLEILEALAPELRESKDERIRKWIVNYIHHDIFNEEEYPMALKAIEWLEKQKESLHISETCKENADSFTDIKNRNIRGCIGMALTDVSESRFKAYGVTLKECLAYLEKQKDSEWSPSEDEMGVLYKLCYISNQVTDEDDTNLTRLYQDLKREYFNGHSFENMFPPEKQKEQKPAEWSDKDEKVYDYLKSGFEYTTNNPNLLNFTLSGAGDATIQDYRNFINKLKILRPQPKQEWSEEDEEMVNTLVSYVEDPSCWNLKCPREKLVAFIKSLPKRFGPHQKQEWSEEDEKTIDTIVSVLGQYIDYKKVSGTGSGYATPKYSKEIDWLKSLRPSWKPSEEQINAFKNSVEHIPNAYYDDMWELYEQLKKLGVKEEPEYYQHFDPDC